MGGGRTGSRALSDATIRVDTLVAREHGRDLLAGVVEVIETQLVADLRHRVRLDARAGVAHVAQAIELQIWVADDGPEDARVQGDARVRAAIDGTCQSDLLL
jgi:hypothetical protein